MYCELDDTEVLYTIKRWAKSRDKILSDLCRRFLTRDFFRVSFLEQKPKPSIVDEFRDRVIAWLVDSGLSSKESAESDAALYFSVDLSRHSPYAAVEDSILVVERDGRLLELSEVADAAAVAALRRFETKPYMSYPKDAM